MASCSTYQSALNKLPNREFAKFEYSRSGNFTATKINAINGKKSNEGIEIEQAIIFTKNPLFQAEVKLEGYKSVK